MKRKIKQEESNLVSRKNPSGLKSTDSFNNFFSGSYPEFDISDNGSTWFILPHFGYRYSKPSNSFNARIYIGPLIGDGFVFFPFGGLSIGYTLK